VHGKLSGAFRGAAPAGALRASKFIPDELRMFLSGGEKQRFEREGGMPQQGFSVAQGCATEKAVQHAAERGHGSRTEARSESAGIATEPYRYAPGSASGGNPVRDRPAVSRGHSRGSGQERPGPEGPNTMNQGG